MAIVYDYKPATKEDWEKVSEYFKPEGTSDQWGNPYALQADHLHRLYDFRRYLGVPIYVTRGVQVNGHSSRSYHYKENGGCATDQVIPDFEGTAVDLILAAERFGFTGIGYYPHWFWGSEDNVIGGLHLDSRPLKWDSDFTLNYREARWMGVKRNGKQHYIPLTFANIKKYGGI